MQWSMYPVCCLLSVCSGSGAAIDRRQCLVGDALNASTTRICFNGESVTVLAAGASH